MNRANDHRWLGAALASFLAFAQFRLIAFMLETDYGRSVDAAWGVVTGHPHWRIFQSRVLGPYLVLGLSELMPHAQAFLTAHVLYSIVTIGIAGYLAFRLGRIYGGDLRSGLLALVLFHLVFACLLARPWLYAWDYLDIIAFLVFIDFVLAGRPWPWFVALYAVAIWNRDSAQFIALWLILDPLSRWGMGRLKMTPPVRFDGAMVASGIALIPIGMAILEILRQTLLVQEMGPLIFPDVKGRTKTALFSDELVTNFHNVVTAFTTVNTALPFMVPLFVVAVVLLAGLLIWRHPVRLMGFGLVCLAMAAAEMCFATLYETRTMVDLIPMVIAAAVILSSPPGIGWAARQEPSTLGDLWRDRKWALATS